MDVAWKGGPFLLSLLRLLDARQAMNGLDPSSSSYKVNASKKMTYLFIYSNWTLGNIPGTNLMIFARDHSEHTSTLHSFSKTPRRDLDPTILRPFGTPK